MTDEQRLEKVMRILQEPRARESTSTSDSPGNAVGIYDFAQRQELYALVLEYLGSR